MAHTVSTTTEAPSVFVQAVELLFVFLAAFVAPLIGVWMVLTGLFQMSAPMVLIGAGLFVLNLVVRRHYR